LIKPFLIGFQVIAHNRTFAILFAQFIKFLLLLFRFFPSIGKRHSVADVTDYQADQNHAEELNKPGNTAQEIF